MNRVNDFQMTEPHMEKGRWYHFFLEYAENTGVVMTNADLEGCTLTATAMNMPEDYIVTDVKYAIHPLAGTASSCSTLGHGVNAAGHNMVGIPKTASYDYADIWVFAYKSAR